MNKSLIAGLLLTCTLPAFGGNTGGATLTDNLQIINVKPTPVFTFTTANHVDPAACTFFTQGWAVKLDEAGQNIYKLVLAANQANKKVNIVGTGSCTDWHNKENIEKISVVEP